MKKYLLSLAALLIAGLGMSAVTLNGAASLQTGKIDAKTAYSSLKRVHKKPVANPLELSYDEPSGNWTEWEAYGTGTLYLKDMLDFYGAVEEYEGEQAGVAVEHRQDAANENIQQFRLKGIFNDADIVIDYYPQSFDMLKIRPQSTNCESFMGMVNVMDFASCYENIDPADQGMTQDEIDMIVEMYNSYNYFVPAIGRFYVFLGFMIEGYMDDACGMCDMEFQLDGFADATPVFDETTFYNAENNKLEITFDPSVAFARYGIFEGLTSQKMIDTLLLNGEGSKTIESSQVIELADVAANKALSVVAITFDKDGAPLEWGSKVFSFVDDEAGEWKSLGQTKVTCDIFESLFFDDVITEMQCEIQQNVMNQGIYRLVNPFGEYYPLNDADEYESTMNHYIVIDATDPDMVMMDMQFTGNDWGGGYFVIVGRASYEIFAGTDPSKVKDHAGVLSNNTISFPEQGILCWCPNWAAFGGNPGSLYYTNISGKTSIEVPVVTSVIDSVAVERNEETRYYNLQGVSVQNPEKGTPVIEVRGSNARKIVL